jgi:hypothetical protein
MMTMEHEDDLGGEASEEMAEPHVRYAPYTPIVGDQAIVSLHDFALSAQRQDEMQRGNFPTMPSSEAMQSYEKYLRASLESDEVQSVDESAVGPVEDPKGNLGAQDENYSVNESAVEVSVGGRA